ncbi:MAG: N-acetylmuramoyl-L-alanine amidase [Bacteroidota bacterium]
MKNFFRVYPLILVASVLFSCASNPYASSNRMHKKQSKTLTKELNTFPPNQTVLEAALNYGDYWAGTTNFNLRKPNYVILHHTAQDSTEVTLNTFTLPRTQVSAHYVIGKDGKIFHMLNDYYRAWHGGIGKWGNDTDLNSTSLGIELDNNGFEPFSEMQIESLIQLLTVLKEKYNIPTANFIGHSDIAPSRKVDPNIFFPWKKLADEGFGLWYDESVLLEDELEELKPKDSLDPKEITLNPGVFTEKRPDPKLALRIIGYDTSDMDAAIKAFKLHYIQKEEIDANLSEQDLKILYNLYKKYM